MIPMNAAKHLSFDIETMDNGPTSAVIGIGARVFTIAGPSKGFEVFISPDLAVQLGSVGQDTMKWWAQQPAYERVFGGQLHPVDAAHRFSQFITEHQPDYVWANSPQFDCVITRHLFKQCSLPVPFHYRDERDLRTLYAIGRDLGLDAAMNECWSGLVLHSPLDDATAQAKSAALILQHIFRPVEAVVANAKQLKKAEKKAAEEQALQHNDTGSVQQVLDDLDRPSNSAAR